MTFIRLIYYLKSVLIRIINQSLRTFKDRENIDIEVLYESVNFLIINKPEDVFINNHNKEVSICNWIF